MSVTVPTTQQLAETIGAQLESELSTTLPWFPKSFARTLAKVLAGVLVILYKYQGFVALQKFARYASTEPTTFNGKTFIPLVEIGREVGVGDPVPATAAELVVALPVVTQSGSLAAGTYWTSLDNGVTYQTKSPVALSAASVNVTVVAVSDQQGTEGLGSVGNLQAGAKLSLAVPDARVSREGTVSSQAVTGAPQEDWEGYRSRVVEYRQNPPQGGAYSDYRVWARGVAGVLAVYPYAGLPNEVDVYVEATTASSGSPDGIPTSAQLLAVAAAIQLNLDGRATRRPVGAAVNVYGISRQVLDLEVVGLLVEDLASVQAQIASAVNSLMRSAEPYIDGLSSPTRKDRIALPTIYGVVDGVVRSNRGTFSTCTLKIAGSVISAFTLDNGQKAKLGAVTYL